MNQKSNDAKSTLAAPARGPGRPQKNDPGMVRVNVQVTAEEHKKLKVYCAQNDTTITDFLRDAIARLP
jgi:hypothetical protein